MWNGKSAFVRTILRSTVLHGRYTRSQQHEQLASTLAIATTTTTTVIATARLGSLVGRPPSLLGGGGSIPPWVPKLFGVFIGFRRCAAGFKASNPLPLPPVCPCSEHACLKPLHPDCVGC